MTLIEVMVVLGLVSLMIAASVRGFRALSRSDVRVTAAKLSGAMKYLFDRASTTGRVHRLVVDLDKGEYYAEVTDNTYYLPREKETEESRALDAERALVEKEEEDKRAKAEAQADPFGTGAGKYQMSRYMPKEWKPKRPKWQPFRESAIRPVKIKNAKVASVYTPRMLDPMSTGKAYVYFFPLGFTEAAWLHVADKNGEGSFTLALHPLTGMVKVYDQYVAPPLQRQVDDLGNEVDR
jgi:general secretion pathway protein H